MALVDLNSYLGMAPEAPTTRRNRDGFISSAKRSGAMMVGGLGELYADVTGDDEHDNALTRFDARVQANNPSEINSLEDIAENPWLALKVAAGNAVGFLGPGLAGKGLGYAGQALKMNRVAQAGTALNSFGAQTAIMGLPTIRQVGEMQRESGEGENDLLKYGAGAAVGAVENLFGVQKMLGIGQLKRGATRTAAQLEREAVERMGATPWRSAGKEFGRMALGEGGEELIQSPIEQMAGYQDPTTAENLEHTAFGGAMGTLGGATFGLLGGARQGLRHRNLREQLRQDQFVAPDASAPTDLLKGLDRREMLTEADAAMAARPLATVGPAGQELEVGTAGPANYADYTARYQQEEAQREANFADATAPWVAEQEQVAKKQSAISVLMGTGMSVEDATARVEALAAPRGKKPSEAVTPEQEAAVAELEAAGYSKKQIAALLKPEAAPVATAAPKVPKTVVPKGPTTAATEKAKEAEALLQASLTNGDLTEPQVFELADVWDATPKHYRDAQTLIRTIKETAAANVMSRATPKIETPEAALKRKANAAQAAKTPLPAVQAKARQGQTLPPEGQVAPDDIQDETHAEGVRMHLAGQTSREIAEALGGSHTNWNNKILPSYGYTFQGKKAADEKQAETGSASTADTQGNAKVDEEATPSSTEGLDISQDVDSGANAYTGDEVVDHSLESGGVVNRGSMDSGAAVLATTDEIAAKEVDAAIKKIPAAVAKRAKAQAAALGLKFTGLLPQQKLTILAAANEGRDVTMADLKKAENLKAALAKEKDKNKLDSKRKAEAADKALADQVAELNRLMEKILSGDETAAADLVMLLAGSNGSRLMLSLRDNLGMPKSMDSPMKVTQYLLDFHKKGRSTAVAEATSKATMTAHDVIEGEFAVVTDEEVAQATNLLPNISAAVETILSDEEKTEVTNHYDLEDSFGATTKKAFLNQYAKWLHSGGKMVHQLSHLFQKMAKAVVNGVLAIAVAFNFNVADLSSTAQAAVPVTKVAVKLAVENPKAKFNGVEASMDAKLVADWQVRKGHGKPFIIADKANGVIYAFDTKGALIAKAPALFGLSTGDVVSAESALKGPDEMTDKDKVTPAGVFTGKGGTSKDYGKGVVDFQEQENAQLSIHRVYLGNPKENRLGRMASASPTDNRISYGCINVTNEFADQILTVHFAGNSEVIVLPETQTASEFFPMMNAATTTTTVTSVSEPTQTAQNLSWGSDHYGVPKKRRGDQRTAAKRKEEVRGYKPSIDGAWLQGQHTNLELEDVFDSPTAGKLHTYKIRTPDGTHVGFVALKLHPSSGSPIGLYVIDIDKKFQRQRLGEKVVAELLDSLPNGLYIDNIQPGKAVVWWKKLGTRLLEGETRWEHGSGILTKDNYADSEAAARGAFETDQLAEGQKTGPEKEGSYFDLDFTKGKPQYSKASAAAADNPTNAQLIKDALKGWFFSGSRLDAKVTVVDKVSDLPADVQTRLADDPNAPDAPHAFVDTDDHVYMIASNIESGQELAVFLHEVGVHLGMEKLLGKESYDKLTGQIKKWSTAKGIEGDIARAAQARATDANEAESLDELLAYFVEEAVNAGVDPTALHKTTGPLAQWFRTLYAALKTALRKVGFDRFDKLTAKDVVNMAYGAARLEIEGTWHGTASMHRKFDHKFMGTGEGNQSFGFGTYLAQRVGIAKGYWKKDVENKWSEGSLMRVDVAVHDNELLDLDAGIPARQLKQVVDGLTAMIKSGKYPDGATKERAASLLLYLTDHGEMLTGAGVHRQVQTMFGADGKVTMGDSRTAKPTSAFLDSVGIKGNKFLDAESRNATPEVIANIENIIAKDKENIALSKKAIAENSGDKSKRAREYVQDVKGTMRLYELALAQHEKDLARVRIPKQNQTRNLVIFNDKNIQRVSSHVGARRDSKSIRYSKKATAPNTKRTGGPALVTPIGITEQAGARMVNDAWSIAKDLTNKALDKVMFTHDLIRRATKQGLKSAAAYKLALDQRDAIKNRAEKTVDQIMLRAAALPEADRTALKLVLKRATMERDKGWKASKDYLALSPKARATVAEIFAYGETTSKEIKRLMLAETNSEWDAMIKRFPHKIKDYNKERAAAIRRIERVMPMNGEPYAPLKRFGDYVTVAKSAAYIAAENAGDEATMEKLIKGDGKQIHYVVEFWPDQGAADRRKRQLLEKHPGWFADISASTKQKQFASMDQLPWSGIAKVKATIDSDPDLAGKEGLHKMMTELYLQMLAEGSARKSEMGRMGEGRGVEGAGDMLRAFASQGRSMAHFLSNLEKSPEISKRIADMRTEAKDNKDLNSTLNEINARYAQGLDYRETPLADKALRATSLWMLMTSPAYYLTNATQTYMVGLPILGGRFGGRAFSEMNKVYGEILPMVKKMGHDISAADFGKTPEEKAMIQHMLDTGRIDITQATDLGRWAEGAETQGKLAKTMAAMNKVFTQVEATNRLSTALTAYRLAATDKELMKKSEAERIDYVASVIDDVQGNYAGNNAPRFFHANGATKLMTQFRKYQLIQISLISKLTHDAFNGSTAEEKLIARKTLAWLLVQQATLTGIKGLPIPAALLMAAGAGLGDDDKDWERNLRKAVGDDDVADLLIGGVPAALGLDISGRVGMGKAFSPLPYTDMEVSKKGFKEAAFGALGPSAALGANFAEGVGKLGDGQYHKGIEMLVPSGLRNILAGYRIATQGVTNNRNDVQLSPDEVSAAAGFMKAVGLPTTSITDSQRQRNDVYELGKHFGDKSNALKTKYAEAHREKDSADMADIREEWKELQAAKVSWAAEMKRQGLGHKDLVRDLKVQPLSTLLKAPQQQAKREAPWVRTN